MSGRIDEYTDIHFDSFVYKAVYKVAMSGRILACKQALSSWWKREKESLHAFPLNLESRVQMLDAKY